MPFSIKFDTVKSEWPIIYIERSQVISFKSNGFLSLKIPFVLTNSADPEKMPHYAILHQSLHCLPVSFKDFL